MPISKVVMAEMVLCVDALVVDVTVTNDEPTATQAAALPVVTAEEVSMVNRTIALTAGAHVMVVLEMDAVAVGVNKMQSDTAPAVQALDVCGMLLTDALLVLNDVMLPVGA